MELFGTAGIRGDAVEEVTPELALSVGRAVGLDARECGDREFVLARDGRVTGPALAAAVEAGLESAGADVRRAGQLPTPALAYASQGRRGVMITASHNPPADNGIKLFGDGVEYDSDVERAVAEGVTEDRPPVVWTEWGDGESVDPLSAYREAVVVFASRHGADLDGLRIVVDCGNGMASLATPQVLGALGADVITLNANVDGHFPGRASKPTPETLTDLRTFVADDEAAAFGIGHDGDADRIVMVDADGEVVHEDTVLAIVAEHYVRASRDEDAGATDAVEDPVVVTTPNASARIDERVREAGGRVERVRLGALHEGITDVEDTGGEVVFAAEPWKHIHPTFGGWIDGVVSAAVFARLVAAEGLDGLRAPVTERPYRKVSIPCPDAAKSRAMGRLESTLPSAFPDADIDTEYGVRLERPDGSWLLVRPSGTEDYVRLYAESEDVDALVEEATGLIEAAIERVGGELGD